MPAKHAALLALVLALSLSGCVYYNTFYHARVAAREAEALKASRAPGTEPGQREKELLERVAEKSLRVVRDHPDSSWADDALLLLAHALHEQGKNESARDRLLEFERLYPDSPMRPEADYLLGAVLMAKGDPVGAEDVLRAVADASPPNSFSDAALSLVGEARNARGRYDDAAEAYIAALERFPRSGLRARIRFLAAENYADAGLLDEAAHQYAAVADEKGGHELAFEARVRLAEVLLDLGDNERALGVLSDLERRIENRDELDRVLLLTGRAHDQAGDIEAALSTYEGVAASHPRSDASAMAFYSIGIIERDRRDDLTAALEAFRKAKEESGRSEGGRLAGEAAADIEKLEEYVRIIESETGAPPDTTEVPRAPADTAKVQCVTPLPPIGVSALPDSFAASTDSLGIVGAAGGSPDTVGIVGAAGGSPDTVEIVRAAGGPPDTAGPAQAGEPPATRLAEIVPALRDTGAAAAPEESKLANARFLLAELYLFRMNRPEKALLLYRDIIADHPGSALAPKAALAVAWILENRLDDRAAATAAYVDVAARYPSTDYAAAAQEAIERLKLAAPVGP